MKESDRYGLTIFKVTVDTFGAEDYPIAVSVRLDVEVRWLCQSYATSTIGIFNRRQLEEAVKAAVTQHTENFAVIFMKTRGEF